jgi:plasmid segregation protein ParM
MNFPESPVVRAVDVGYGNTKYVLSHQEGKDVVCRLFPSIAPQAAATKDLAAGVFSRRNTATVEVNGMRYEVGKDAELAQDTSYGRILDAEYSMSDAYMALLLGALYYMRQPRIDMLVLGLPVHLHDQLATKLRNRVVGAHVIPSPHDESQSQVMRVEVATAHVIPQPIGAFLDHSIRSMAYNRMKNEMNLLVDPGYYTLDWVVARGVKMVNARSGAHPGSMSAVLRAIGDAISPALGSPITDYSEIDNAIREDRNPYFFGHEFTDFPKYLAVGRKKARQFVQVLVSKVGHGIDIQNIILAGGGAAFFRGVIEEKFPRHNIQIAGEPVYANVRGFQLAGTQFMNQLTFTNLRSGGKA